MSRRSYKIIEDPTPPSVIYIADWKVVSGRIIDAVTGYAHPNFTAGTFSVDGEYFYRSKSPYTVANAIPISPTKSVPWYSTSNATWMNNTTPSQMVNGVSPEYYNQGVRLETSFYIAASASDRFRYFSCVKANNSSQRGFGLVWNCSDTYITTSDSSKGLKFVELNNNYRTIAWKKELPNFQLPIGMSNEHLIQCDISNDSLYRIKVFKRSDKTLLADSGIRTYANRCIYPLGINGDDSIGPTQIRVGILRSSLQQYHNDFLQ